MCVLLKRPVSQGDPGAWDRGLLTTGLYSLKWKPGQLDSGFKAGEEHPGKKKLPGFTGNLKAFKLACLDLRSEKLSDSYVFLIIRGMLGVE